ncbi:Protein NPR-15 [Aphelenchoides avenae]|nr:Protein NPR-15 [Aphelenchus avenae]
MVSVVGSKKMRAQPVNMLLFNLAMSDFTYIVCNDRIGIHDWPAWMPERLWWFPSWMCPVNRYISSAAFMASIGNFVAIAIESTTYIFPIVVAVALYPRTCRAVWAVDPGVKGKSVKVVAGLKVSGDDARSSVSDQDRRQIVKMLVVCVVIFFVGYTPIVTIFVRSHLFSRDRYLYETEFILVASELVKYICAFNPFIYTLFSAAFRQRVKGIVTCQHTIDLFLSLLFLVGFYVAIHAQEHRRKMGESGPFSAAIHYSLLVQTIVVLLVDCYTICTRLMRFSEHLASYLNTFIVTTVGYTANAFVVISVVGSKKMRASPVNMLLFNLAVSDFTYIVSNDRIGIHDWPAWMHRFWWLPGWVCPINRYKFIWFLRYIVTVRPLQARLMCSRSKLFYWVLVIWTFAFVFELPNYVAYDTFDAVDYYKNALNITLYDTDSNSTDTLPEKTPLLCINLWRFATLWKVFKWVEFCVSYIFPIVVAIALYPRTCRAVWAVDTGVQGTSLKVVAGSKVSGSGSSGSERDRRQVVKMLIACVVVFFVCYTLLVIIVVRSELFPSWHHRFEREFVLVASELIVYACAFNPFIYTLFSTMFRQRVKEIVACRHDVFLALLFLVGFYVTIHARL